MSDLYENLLRATDNTSDIAFEKYGTITKIENSLCGVIEEDTNLEHTSVPILNKVDCQVGDKVVLGFIENSIYNPIILGNLSRKTSSGSGGSRGGSFRINEEGHLIVTLPSGSANPYKIEDGHLIYSTEVQIFL